MSMKSLLLVASLVMTQQHLAAVTAADMLGTWQVDTDATWERLKKMPVVTGLSADQVSQVKAALIEQFKNAVFEFTAGKLTVQVGGENKQESFVVSKIDGESIYTDDTASDGKVTHSRVDVIADELVVNDIESPSEIIVLRRKDASAAAATTPAPAPAPAPAP
jgi:hypothetical protein